MLDCVYINLDSATRRRSAIESNFARFARPGATLARFPAVTVRDVADRGIEGKIRPNERACFMSHRELILGHPAGAGSALMVLEDDAHFGPTFFSRIGRFLDPARFKWDILFTDVCITGASEMVQLARMRPDLMSAGGFRTIDLSRIVFAGATAYIVNPASLDKIKGLLAQVDRCDLPYDLYLRSLIRRGAITAGFVFPFLTTLSEHSDDSAIQPEETNRTDLIWNTYRRLMWVDRADGDCTAQTDFIRDHCCDAESLLLAPILCAMSSRQFRNK